MAKHTAGPWYDFEELTGTRYLSGLIVAKGEDGEPIAIARMQKTANEADKRLIIEAPKTAVQLEEALVALDTTTKVMLHYVDAGRELKVELEKMTAERDALLQAIGKALDRIKEEGGSERVKRALVAGVVESTISDDLKRVYFDRALDSILGQDGEETDRVQVGVDLANGKDQTYELQELRDPFKVIVMEVKKCGIYVHGAATYKRRGQHIAVYIGQTHGYLNDPTTGMRFVFAPEEK